MRAATPGDVVRASSTPCGTVGGCARYVGQNVDSRLLGVYSVRPAIEVLPPAQEVSARDVMEEGMQ
jgi:hypothetical protein